MGKSRETHCTTYSSKYNESLSYFNIVYHSSFPPKLFNIEHLHRLIPENLLVVFVPRELCGLPDPGVPDVDPAHVLHLGRDCGVHDGVPALNRVLHQQAVRELEVYNRERIKNVNV